VWACSGCAALCGGLFHAGVALDGVQGDVEAAGAFEQADALAEEMVDPLPALAGGLLAYAAGPGGVHGGGPAAGVGANLGQDLAAQVAPQVPSVADLHRFGQSLADRLGVGCRAVPAYGLDAGVFAQPGDQGPGGAVGQDVDAFAGFGVDDHGGIAVPALEGEVVDADHPWDLHDRSGDAHEQAQGGGVGDRHGQSSREAGGRPAA